jgi:hypothetical protein
MTIAWSSIAYAQPNILVNKRVLAWLARGSSLRPHLRVHAEIYLYIEGLPGVRNLNTWNSLDFLSACWESALSWKAGKRNE